MSLCLSSETKLEYGTRDQFAPQILKNTTEELKKKINNKGKTEVKS